MSKMIYAIFLVLGTIVSAVHEKFLNDKPENDMSLEEIKEDVKSYYKEKLSKHASEGNEDLV